MTDGVPLAKYAPRGSAESVANIASALRGSKNTSSIESPGRRRAAMSTLHGNAEMPSCLG
jgi:hypothetical protein